MKKIYCVTLLVLLCRIAISQTWSQRIIQFSSTQVYTDQTTTVLDYDDDGNPDILYGNNNLRELFLLRNNDDHILQLEQLADSFYNVLYLHGFEYNNDGLDDFIIACETETTDSETFFLAIHQPDHSFQWYFMGYAPYEGLQSMFTLDLDDDGDMDVVYDDYANSNVIWLLTNNGDNTFTQSMISYTGQPTRLYGVEDLDLDGDKDLMTAYYSFSSGNFVLVAQENTGGMNFIAHESLNLPGAGDGSVLDTNDDGYPDLVLASHFNSGNTIIIENNGDWTFANSSISLSISNYAYIGIGLDYDSDGDTDFFASDNEQLLLMKQNPNGTFVSQVVGDGYIGDMDAYLDIDGDGFQDIISNNIEIWKRANNNFQRVFDNYLHANGIPLVIDMGPDLNPDVIVSGPAGQVSYFQQRYDEKMEYATDQFLTGANVSFSTSVREFLSYDKDNDGDLDLLCQVADYIYWLVNNNGTFTQSTVATGVNGLSMWVGDLDNDGKHDILFHVSPLKRWEWNGNSYVATNFNFDPTSDYEVMDVDGDSDLDILYFGYDINTFNTTVNYMKNNNGSFSSVYCVTLLDYFTSQQSDLGIQAPLEHADMDGDGDEDLVFGSTNADYLGWLRNEGSDLFTPIIISEDFSDIAALALGDIDSDGDMDIATSYGNDSNLQLFYNDGVGNFSLQPVTAIVSAPKYVIIKDMDNDGDNDILYNSVVNRRIGWLQNDSINCPRSYAVEEAHICPLTDYEFGGEFISEPGFYTDTITSISGCDSVRVLFLDVFDLPNITISQNGNTITANSGFASYQWLLNDVVLENETSNTMNVGPYGIGEYQVVCIDENGCSNFSTINITTIIGIDENIETNASVWPVPFEDVLFIQPGSLVVKETQIVDQTGRVVYTGTNSGLQTINTADLPSGVYRVILTSNNGTRKHLSAIKK